ncbi:MAG TPA: patatin-like phospholipase family protein [Actinomycetota bacterium]|jgi:NTE family protein
MSTQPSRTQWLRRLALRRREERVAFAFSGGGPLGAMQVGALKALLEFDVKPDMVVGTSVGALNATWTAFDPSPEGVKNLESLWRGLTDSDLFPGGRFRASWARFLVRGNRVFDNSGIRKLVETRLGADVRFEDAQIPLGMVATELEGGAEELFTSGRLMEPLLASTAMPGVFPPVDVGGKLYIDGGVVNNVPIAPAATMGARTIYVLNSTSHQHQRRPLLRPIDYMLHAFSLARSQRYVIEQAFITEKVRLVLLPSGHVDMYVPFASMAYTDKLIGIGYEATCEFLSGAKKAEIKTIQGGSVEAIAPAK